MCRRRVPTILHVIVLVQGLLLLSACWFTGPGWDEWGHLPSGLYHVQHVEMSPYCVNPPLIRMLAAVPVWLLGGGLDYEDLYTDQGFRVEFFLALKYIQTYGADCFYWMSIARTVLIPVSLFGTYLIGVIGHRFFGMQCAILSSVLWAFSPIVLAFGSAVTPDVGAAVFGLFAAWRLFLWLRLGTWRSSLWTGISMALAVLSKSTWLMFPPFALFAAIVYCFWHRSRIRLRRRVGQFTCAMGLMWLVVNACYNFQGCMVPLGDYEFVSLSLGGTKSVDGDQMNQTGNRFRGTFVERWPVLWPASYVRGIDIQKRDFEVGMQSYFLGKWRATGWYHYYAVGLLLKEPIWGWLIVVFVPVAASFYRTKSNRTQIRSLAFIAGPGLLVFAFVSSQTGFNHHLRYVLAVLPSLYLISTASMSRLPRGLQRYVYALLILYMVASMSSAPRFYAYFSEVIGGSKHGWKYLGFSNVDWGQDLLLAKTWTRNISTNRPVYVLHSSFPLINLRQLGIEAENGNDYLKDGVPNRSGHWLVMESVKTEPRGDWFRDRQPNERLSISTSRFLVQIDDQGNAIQVAD